MSAASKLQQELKDLFGIPLPNGENNAIEFADCNTIHHDSEVIHRENINLLQARAWLGKMSSEGLRGLCWRVLLGVLKERTYLGWSNEFKQQYIRYEALKEEVNPSIASVVDDPLSSLSNGGPQSTEWDQYYIKIELSNLIRVDLDRLYMPGIDDEYFHEPGRKERLLSVLFIWALKYPKIAYRQGMHELVGTISYVLETEHLTWKASGLHHPLVSCFSEEYLESQIYWLFDRIMRDLIDLYDPMPMTNSAESVPQIVDYCTRIQEHFLRQIDPELCERLEEAYIQGQIYGLRWARLLLGREFTLSHTQSLRIWDYMFASCMDNPLAPATSSARIEELRSAQASVSSASSALHARYGSYSPLMGVLGDFMLAMLLHIREQLVCGDSNEVLGLLMKYPAVNDVTPIMDLADMLRRGVLNCGAHLGPPPPPKNRQRFLRVMEGRRTGNQHNYSPHSNAGAYNRDGALYAGNSNHSNSTQPSWLLTNPILPVLNSSTLNQMSRKMTEQISAVSSAVKNGNPWKSHDAHPHAPDNIEHVDPLSGAITVTTRSASDRAMKIDPTPKPLPPPTTSSPHNAAKQQQDDLIDWFLGTAATKSTPTMASTSSPTPTSRPVSKDVALQVSDRLMDVAVMLSQSRPMNLASYNLMTEAAAMAAMQEQLEEEEVTRYEAARRLRLLCDILAGHSPFQSYDHNIEAASLISAHSRDDLSLSALPSPMMHDHDSSQHRMMADDTTSTQASELLTLAPSPRPSITQTASSTLAAYPTPDNTNEDEDDDEDDMREIVV